MNCTTARDLLLEAESLDLRGEGETELSRHLRGCSPCRAAAEAIMRAEASLKHRLDASRPTRSVEQIVQVSEKRRGRARRAWQVLPLAAAAGLAVILLVRRPPALFNLVPPAAPPPPRISVTAPPGHNVAVLQSDNPDVVIYWFF